VQVTVTTATCIADYLSWSEFSNAQKMELGKLYVPYLALGMFCLSFSRPVFLFFPKKNKLWTNRYVSLLAVFMAVDMLGRLNGAVGRRPVDQGRKLK
jgi:hypothetical protein